MPHKNECFHSVDIILYLAQLNDQKYTVCLAHINIFVTFPSSFCCSVSLVCCLCCLWLCKYPQSPIILHLQGSSSPLLSSTLLSPFSNLILSFNKSPFCPQWKCSMCLKLLCTPQSWPLHLTQPLSFSPEHCSPWPVGLALSDFLGEGTNYGGLCKCDCTLSVSPQGGCHGVFLHLR